MHRHACPISLFYGMDQSYISQAQEVARQAKKTPKVRKACTSTFNFQMHISFELENMFWLAQGREWMKALKDLCGENLLKKKFVGHRRKSGLRTWMFGLNHWSMFWIGTWLEVFCSAAGELHREGSEVDTLDTMPVEFAGEVPLAAAQPGAIPDICSPSQDVMGVVFRTMWNDPPVPFNPREQFKKNFRNRCKAGRIFFCFPAHWKWSCSFWSVYGLCGGLVMQEQRQWKRRNRRVDVCMRHVYTQDAVYPNTTGRWCKRTCWDCEGTSVIVFDVLDVPRDRTVWVQKNFFDNTFQILSDSCSKPKNDNVIAIAQMATSLRTFYHPYPKDSSTTMNKQYLQQAWISHSII